MNNNKIIIKSYKRKIIQTLSTLHLKIWSMICGSCRLSHTSQIYMKTYTNQWAVNLHSNEIGYVLCLENFKRSGCMTMNLVSQLKQTPCCVNTDKWDERGAWRLFGMRGANSLPEGHSHVSIIPNFITQIPLWA